MTECSLDQDETAAAMREPSSPHGKPIGDTVDQRGSRVVTLAPCSIAPLVAAAVLDLYFQHVCGL
jgi:hypothetical protein